MVVSEVLVIVRHRFPRLFPFDHLRSSDSRLVENVSHTHILWLERMETAHRLHSHVGSWLCSCVCGYVDVWLRERVAILNFVRTTRLVDAYSCPGPTCSFIGDSIHRCIVLFH